MIFKEVRFDWTPRRLSFPTQVAGRERYSPFNMFPRLQTDSAHVRTFARFSRDKYCYCIALFVWLDFFTSASPLCLLLTAIIAFSPACINFFLQLTLYVMLRRH